MKTQSLALAMTIINFIVIVLIAAKSPNETTDKLTVREFEVVDQYGKQRVSIKVEDDGEVVFRLRDSDGNVRTKLGASKDGSGLVMLDEKTNLGIQALAKKDKTFITVTGKDGKKKEY